MIEVIDYGAGNLGSLLRCLERLGLSYQRVDGLNPPTGNHPLLFPGVGAFGTAMANLNRDGLTIRLQSLLHEGTPYLGICIGLQVLFEESEEAPGISGLGLIPGRIVRFRKGKVPQIGWNWIQPLKNGWNGGYVYFVNSYYPHPVDRDCILYQADYHGPFTAAIQQGAITACQFHPEKSGLFGQKLIGDWAKHV